MAKTLCTVLTAVAGTVAASAAFAQPINDNCADAIAVANHSSTPFDLTTATRDGFFSCNNLAGSTDIWYTYTATGPETVTVDLCGSQDATKSITVFAGGCGSAEIACSRTSVCGSGGQPRVVFNAPAAGTYLIAVARRGSSPALAGMLNVNAIPYVAPPGDTCADAIVIPGPGSYAFDSTAAGTDGAPGPCNIAGRPDTHDLYFSYTPTSDGWITFDTLQNAQSPGATASLNTTLQVYSGCGGELLACNDDKDYTGAAFNLRVGSLTCPLHVTANTNYIVRVATSGANSSGGAGILRLTTVEGPTAYAVPAGAQPEPGPACDTDWYTDVNFGCNGRVSPPEFRAVNVSFCNTYKGHIAERSTPISSGELIHDLDAYHFVLTAAETVRVRGQAQFVGLVTLMRLPCVTGTIFTGDPDQDLNPECGAADFDLAWDLSAGEYMLAFGVAPLNRPVCGINDEYWFTITGSAPCTGPCVADLGGAGGIPGADGVLNNNDFIAFINYFFTGDEHADVGVSGGLAGHDGLYDNNDFIAFVNAFFAGCP